MRTKLVAVIVAAFLVATATGCRDDSRSGNSAGHASAPPIAAPDKSSTAPSNPAVTTSAPANTSKICDSLVNWAAVQLTDAKDPTTAKFLELIENGGTGLDGRRKVAIRQAYYRKQERAIRSLAATATDPHVRTLLGKFADSWGALANDTSDDGPATIQPSRAPINSACPGIEHRIDSVSEAGGN